LYIELLVEEEGKYKVVTGKLVNGYIVKINERPITFNELNEIINKYLDEDYNLP